MQPVADFVFSRKERSLPEWYDHLPFTPLDASLIDYNDVKYDNDGLLGRIEDAREQIREIQDAIEAGDAPEPVYGYSCLNTATNNYGPKYMQASNRVFASDPGRYGFEKIALADLQPGDIVIDRFGGTPHHGMIFNGYNGEGVPTFNYSSGASDPDADWAIRKNGTYTGYPMDDEHYFGYRFVGLPEDIDRWGREWDAQNGAQAVNIEAAGGGIHIDPSKKGTFKAQATRMGMGVKEAARHILAHKDRYSPAMVRKANFARNFAAFGGPVNRFDGAEGSVLQTAGNQDWGSTIGDALAAGAGFLTSGESYPESLQQTAANLAGWARNREAERAVAQAKAEAHEKKRAELVAEYEASHRPEASLYTDAGLGMTKEFSPFVQTHADAQAYAARMLGEGDGEKERQEVLDAARDFDAASMGAMLVIPAIGTGSALAYSNPITGTLADVFFAQQSLQNLAGPEGLRKTAGLLRDGEYGKGALSFLGDAFNAAVARGSTRHLIDAWKNNAAVDRAVTAYLRSHPSGAMETPGLLGDGQAAASSQSLAPVEELSPILGEGLITDIARTQRGAAALTPQYLAARAPEISYPILNTSLISVPPAATTPSTAEDWDIDRLSPEVRAFMEQIGGEPVSVSRVSEPMTAPTESSGSDAPLPYGDITPYMSLDGMGNDDLLRLRSYLDNQVNTGGLSLDTADPVDFRIGYAQSNDGIDPLDVVQSALGNNALSAVGKAEALSKFVEAVYGSGMSRGANKFFDSVADSVPEDVMKALSDGEVEGEVTAENATDRLQRYIGNIRSGVDYVSAGDLSGGPFGGYKVRFNGTNRLVDAAMSGRGKALEKYFKSEGYKDVPDFSDWHSVDGIAKVQKFLRDNNLWSVEDPLPLDVAHMSFFAGNNNAKRMEAGRRSMGFLDEMPSGSANMVSSTSADSEPLRWKTAALRYGNEPGKVTVHTVDDPAYGQVMSQRNDLSDVTIRLNSDGTIQYGNLGVIKRYSPGFDEASYALTPEEVSALWGGDRENGNELRASAIQKYRRVMQAVGDALMARQQQAQERVAALSGESYNSPYMEPITDADVIKASMGDWTPRYYSPWMMVLKHKYGGMLSRMKNAAGEDMKKLLELIAQAKASAKR